jgi:nuclear transcription factor Y gamma
LSSFALNIENVALENWKIQTLPLARIKKIMKSEEFILQELEKEKQQKSSEENQEDADKPNVKFMISGEAPVLMSKACELLIRDLSFRAWRHTERNRRRTLQRQDLHAAVGESEVYDFLIDIVPRVTAPKTSVPSSTDPASGMAPTMPPGIPLGLPTVPPPVMASAPPGVAQMPPGMDNNMMQQIQQQQQQQQQQFQDQQQQHQFANFLNLPPMNATDMSQGGMQPMNAQQTQQPQWMTQPVPNNGNSAPPG